jgi:predicted  nucleic acid-binding Zn-ribbon protein
VSDIREAWYEVRQVADSAGYRIECDAIDAEIERLRTDLKDSSAEIVMNHEEIERLRDEAIHNEGVMVALREGYTEAKERVEMLEDVINELQGTA